jgi:hypothetical protein
MSVLWRIVSVGALALSGGLLVLAVVSVRKEQRVRPGFDLLRLGISLTTTALMARFLGVETSEGLMGLGLLLGILFGLWEGLHLKVRFLGSRAFARRTLLGIVAWGAGVLVVQLAGVADRVGMADLGLSLSFVGVGQIVGLLTGRWEVVLGSRRAGLGGAAAAVLGVLLGMGLLAPPPARAQAAVDLRAVMAGQAAGLSVEVRGNGTYFGPALTLYFVNETGSDATVAVPVGLQFLPEDETTQTMIGAGGEMLVVPGSEEAKASGRAQSVPGRGEAFTTQIEAFCGEYHDDIPTSDDIFTAGPLVTGAEAGVIGLINQEGVFGLDQQWAVWHFTDGMDVSGSATASELVEHGGGTGFFGGTGGCECDEFRDEGTAPLGEVPHCDCATFSAGEGARTSMLGLVGSALLLLSGFSASGNSLASVASAWRSGKVRGLHDLAAGVTPPGPPAWRMVGEELTRGRAAAVLGGLPPGLGEKAHDLLAARLQSEQSGQWAEAVKRALGPVGEADPAGVLGSHPGASALLARLPAEARAGVEAQVVAGLKEEHLRHLVDAGVRAVRHDQAVGLLKEALERKDGTAAGQVLGAVGPGDAEAVWREATGGAGPAVSTPPPSAAGADLWARLDTRADLGEAVSNGTGLRATLSGLPGEVRQEVEHRLGARLEAERLGRWVAKLRGGGAGERPGLLSGLAPGLRQRVEEHAAGVFDGEAVERLAGQARHLAVEGRASALLREAVAHGDGDRADAVMDAVDAALGAVDEADLERVAEGAGVAVADLASLARTAAVAPPVDLIGGGEGVDLLAAARQAEGVDQVLEGAGEALRPRVEEALGDALEAGRLEGAVRAARRALDLDRVQEDLSRAVAGGDLAAVDRLLAGLSPAQAAEMSRAVLGGGT